jgi:hypothetical protein
VGVGLGMGERDLIFGLATINIRVCTSLKP